jgi:PAS domain S-box-containing protein
MRAATETNELNDKILRWQANGRLLNKLHKNPEFSTEDIRAMISELTLRRIESTELQCVREELTDCKNQYQELYNLYPAGYLVLSEDNIIKEANKVIARDLNEKIDDIIGVDFLRFVPPDSQDAFYRYIVNLLQTCSQKACGLFLKKNDGETFAVKVIGYARKANKGKFDKEKFDIRLIVSTPQDLLKAGTNPIVLLDMEGKILFVNNAMYRAVGYSNRELVGESIADILAAEDQSRVMKTLIKARMGILTAKNIEFGIKCKNQQYQYYKSVPRPLKINGQIQGFAVVLHSSSKRSHAGKEPKTI